MLRPASARAPLLITPEAAARDPETDGEKEPLAPDPETEAEVLALLAEADCEVVSCGLLRAAFMAEADCARDCREAMLILWLFSARA